MTPTPQKAERQAHDRRYAVHPGSGNLHQLRPAHSLLQIGTDGPPRCYCGHQPDADQGWAGISTDPDELDPDGRADGCLSMGGGGR